MIIPIEPSQRLRRPSLRRAKQPHSAPTSLADKIFPPQPSLARRLRALPAAWRTRWAGWAKPSTPNELSAPAFWRRVGGQTLRANGRELSLGMRISLWASAVSQRLFVKFMRWSWQQRHSRLFGFAWRAVRKTLHAELAEMSNSFKMLGSAFLLWQKAAFKAAWWDFRRRLPHVGDASLS